MNKNKIFRFPNFWMEQEVEISKFFDGYMSDFQKPSQSCFTSQIAVSEKVKR